MKKIFNTLLFFFCASFIYGQTGLVNNAQIKIDQDAYIKIQGSNAHYVHESDGKIKLDGTFQLNGNWSNLAATPDIWLGSSEGDVEFMGTAIQHIYGKTHFIKLHVKNQNGVILNDTLLVNNLFINDGLLDADGNEIMVFGNWLSDNGVFMSHNNHVLFVGDMDQTIQTDVGQHFNKLTINNNHKLHFVNAAHIANLYVTSGSGEGIGHILVADSLIYNGTAAQLTGDEWLPNTTFDVLISNTSTDGLSLSGSKQIATTNTVVVDGVFNMGLYQLSDYGNFLALSGATLDTEHASGLDGNLTTIGMIDLGSATNFIYSGSTAQQTGTLLPDVINNLTIDNASGEVLLTNTGHTIINGDITATNGGLILNPEAALTVNGNVLLNTASGLVLKSDHTGTASFIDNGQISGTGTALVEKYLRYEPLSDDFGRYLSMPVFDAHTSMFYDPANDGVWFYNTTQSPPTWMQISNDYLDAMTGYVTRFVNTAFTVDLEGSLNTGQQSRTDLARTSENFGWNLIGNPYPSALDFSDPSILLHNVNPSIYFRPVDGGSPYAFNRNTGIGVPLGTTGIIPSMQAFWVQVTIGESVGSVTFENSARLHHMQSAPYQKSNLPLIRLSADNNMFSDELAVVFIDQATSAFDAQYDALNMGPQNPNYPDFFSFSSDSFELKINALPFDDTHIVVPLGYSSNTYGMHAIEAFDFDNIDAHIDIYLEDKEATVMHNLRQNQMYAFNYTDSCTVNRFDLHFMYQTVDTDDVFAETDSGKHAQIYAYNNTVYINFTEASGQKFEVHIYNMLGQLIYADRIPDTGQLHPVNLNAARGHYVVHLYNDAFNKVQKVAISR